MKKNLLYKHYIAGSGHISIDKTVLKKRVFADIKRYFEMIKMSIPLESHNNHKCVCT